MDKFYPPYFPCYIPLPNGKPAAGGKLYAYYTGTDNLAPLYAEDGTILVGSVADIDSSGQVHVLLDPAITYRLKVVPPVGSQMPDQIYDNVRVANGTIVGMENPMIDQGDMIVGGAGGEPSRLGVGTDGDILVAALYGGFLSPKWEAGPKKYRNVYHNIPSPDIDDGYLGCLFYLDDTATLTLPSSANIPSKSFIDFVFLDGTATLTITPQGTTTLNAQATAVTIGGQAATLYRLTFLGHGGSGDEWALGGSGNGDHKVSADGTDTAGYLEDKIGAGSGISLATSAGKVVVSATTQPGDHKTAVDGADASPDYLANKLAAGSGISLTNTGSAVEIAADAQSGDHQLLVSATDAVAGYLGAKLTAGANVTLTPQTDGDGVQTLEISAAGGGGGGSDWTYQNFPGNSSWGPGGNNVSVYTYFRPLGPTVRSVMCMAGAKDILAVNATFTGEIGIYSGTAKYGQGLDSITLTRVAQKAFSSMPMYGPQIWLDFDSDVDVSDRTKVWFFAFLLTRWKEGRTPTFAVTTTNSTGNDTQCYSSNWSSLPASLTFPQLTRADILCCGVSSTSQMIS